MAIDYDALGFLTFPAEPNDKVPSKAHDLRGWQKKESSIPIPDGYNIAGMPPVNVICFDLDVKNNPSVIEEFQKMVDPVGLYDGLEEITLTHATPSGGRHVFFQCDFVPAQWQNSRASSGNSNFPLGVDSRVRRQGYVVLPPSVVDGRPYEVLCDMPIADIPPTLAELVQHPRNARSQPEQIQGYRLIGNVAGSWKRFEYTEGGRDNALFKMACQLLEASSECSFDGLVDVLDRINSFCAHIWMSAPLTREEVVSKARSAWKRANSAESEGSTVFVPPWVSETRIFKETFDLLNADIRWNVRTRAYEILYKDETPKQWRPLMNSEWRALMSRMEKSHVLIPDLIVAGGKDNRVYTLAKAKPMHWRSEQLMIPFDYYFMDNTYDPMLEYFDSLPEWDQQPRINGLLHRCFECDADKAYVEYVSGSIFGGVVRRTLTPGCKWDWVPVFVGPDGVGKSTFARKLLPDESLFGDSMHFSLDQGRQIEVTLGKAIVEISEMAGSTRAHNDYIKIHISKQTDNYRLAYRRDTEEIPRRFIFIGTSNPGTPLPKDREGNRRFLTFGVDKLSNVDSRADNAAYISALLIAERDQLWAEALYKVQNGDLFLLPGELEDTQKEYAERFRYDPDEAIRQQIEELLPYMPEHFTMLELVRRMNRDDKINGDRVQKRYANNIAKILANLTPPVLRKNMNVDGRTQWRYINHLSNPAMVVAYDAENDFERMKNIKEILS